ncbi:low temperature requirement protein A [Micromonospora sp. NPDC050980]|uniref:low temperature requirement protein A n=1 Tax=Micromonospora sp. NPDC050980 TaxID=3155161 RepID=UPI0033F4C381
MPTAPPEPADPRPPVRDPEAPRRVTLLELFFDLVYVVALALVSRYLIRGVGWERAAESLVILMAIWWTWAITTLVTDLYDPGRAEIKLLVVAVMFGALLMTTAIPEAFGARGLVFAGTYVAIHLGRGVFLMPAVRRHPETRRRAIRILVWFAVSAVPWLIGAVAAHGHARIWFWAGALAIDYLGFRLAYPVPGLGSVPEAQRNVTAEHLSERYQQFFIIALGDAVLVSGTVFSLHHSEVENIAAFTTAFTTTLLLWRIYVHKSGELLPHAIARSSQPSFLITAPYTHLLMVAGVVTAAAGFDLVLLEPTGRTPPAWLAVILGGPALFLAGRAAFEYEVFSRVSRSRPGGILALLTIAPALLFLAPVYAAVGAMLVLAGVAGADHLRSRGRPPEEPVPPH